MDVMPFSKEKYSKVVIKKILKEEDIDLSEKTITRLLKNVGIVRDAISKKEPTPNNNLTLTKCQVND